MHTASEPATNLQPRLQPIREISLKLGSSSAQVDVQVADRAGRMHVAVRTQDQELTKSLQANLGDLVDRLEQKGYKAETWTPGAPLHGSKTFIESAGNSGSSQDQPGSSGSWAGREQQQRNQQEPGRRQPAPWTTQLKQKLSEEDSMAEDARMEDR